MSYVAKTYEFIGKVQQLFNKKLFSTIFIAIASMFLFFGVMNVYAESTISDDGVISSDGNNTLKADWKGMKTFINLANGLGPAKQAADNMGSQGILSVGNAANTGIALFAPSLTVGAAEIQASADVPEDMKLGLLGIADSAMTYAYTGYPAINVPSHLAEEWIPGYENGNSSVYAASQNGYETLIYSGIGDLWEKVRDIAYVFFVIVMIVVGFMIMFRSKIGGQTLVSLGNFLPGVITSLILITFSFAIAGVLIDLGSVVTSFIATLYGGPSFVSPINTINDLFTAMFTGGTAGTTLVVAGVADASMIGGLVATIAGATVGGLALGPILAVGGLLVMLVALVVLGIIFVGAVKVIITLYKAFFGILLSVITAPIQIMIGAFPGKGYSTTNWFLTLLRNVLTFPMVYAIVNLPSFIARQADITLNLPAGLSGATSEGNALGLNNGFGGFLVMFVLRIAALYFAAQAPKYLEAWFPANTPKPVAEGLAKAQESLTKIPLVGGLFK
jgi:hypothetical protein